MNFQSAQKYLYGLMTLPRKEYMSDPRHCGIYLKRLQFFLDLVGNPERKIQHYIHVTGTSGKGSLTFYLHNILKENGEKVGSNPSPHATEILERWMFNGKLMKKNEFVEIIEFLKPKIDEYLRITPYDILSFYEITEVISLLYFVKKQVNWAVVEVACGGRYDASNIIPWKDAAVITNIGLDHVGIIGNNKEEIAYEKAGIIKPGCQVFTAEKNKTILNIIEKECQKNKTALNIFDYKYKLISSNLNETIFSYQEETFQIPGKGIHQVENACLAINVAKALKIPLKPIKTGLQKTKLPIRFEIVQKKPLIILDGAHNEDKMKTTIEATKTLLTTQQNPKVNVLIGFSQDKNWPKMLDLLTKIQPANIICTRYTINQFRVVANPRAIADYVKKKIPNSKIHIYLDPLEALSYSRKISKNNDILLITGSIFLSGELRPYLTKKKH